jgi:hypothetical protein
MPTDNPRFEVIPLWTLATRVSKPMTSQQTRRSAFDRLALAKDYLQSVLLSMPVPACDSRPWTYAEEAKRKAAWNAYLYATNAIRRIERTRLGLPC